MVEALTEAAAVGQAAGSPVRTPLCPQRAAEGAGGSLRTTTVLRSGARPVSSWMCMETVTLKLDQRQIQKLRARAAAAGRSQAAIVRELIDEHLSGEQRSPARPGRGPLRLSDRRARHLHADAEGLWPRLECWWTPVRWWCTETGATVITPGRWTAGRRRDRPAVWTCKAVVSEVASCCSRMAPISTRCSN